ncbi:uncharacterized protein C05D11.1-like [Porites lutea]|uniref:uncharacterized protein C05D11.1-like n=1 Tax=Porites lutea TaxID=51062 RepID=UPI003CC68DD4
MAEHFELLSSFVVLDSIPVKKYRSKRTGINFCFAEVPGPLVNGFLCLATEAHDDDGLPHTLEHLVFMGSENYPYKGLLDLLANRCLAQGTNAWTATDHTAYTMETAGSEGFLNLLPIYLDHVLYPTLTESAYITEVHHVNGEGEDAGVVYCEMQGRENMERSLTFLNFTREMYPGHCGYKSETGGIMENLRSTCSHAKVCSYHQQFYRPENLCAIITGQIDPVKVFQTVKSFEDKILTKKTLPPYKRPWQTPVPPLSDAVEKVVRFPTEDEESGSVLLGFRGPICSDRYGMTALSVILDYLTDTPIAPLQRDLVEIPDPFCSDISCDILEYLESCLVIKAKNVPFEKLNATKEKIKEVLGNLAEGKEVIDMSRMDVVIHRKILDTKNNFENHAHDTFADAIVGDFLYSTKAEDLHSRLGIIQDLEKLQKETVDYWVAVLKNYFSKSSSSVVIIGEPSSKMMTEMSETEKKRVAEQIATLGEEGLKSKRQRLEKATDDNEVAPPPEVVTSLPVPSISSISFHPIKMFSNRRQDGCSHSEPEAVKFPVSEIPYAFQLDHVSTLFVKLSVLMDTASIPEELKPYLSLYLEVLFESPVLRENGLVPFEQVVAELAADTLSQESCLGLEGRRFMPDEFSQLACVSLKLEVEKYEKGVNWLHDLLYKTQFTKERLEIVGKKMMNDVARMKRDGRTVTKVLIRDIAFTRESNMFSANMVRQYSFLNKVMTELEADPTQVIERVEKLRSLLTQPSNLRVHVAADVNRLPDNPNMLWKTKLLADASVPIPTSISPVRKSSAFLAKNPVHGKIAGIGSVESSFLFQVTRCFDSFDHPDLGPLMVFLECLTTLEGPIWRQVRGLGLSYGYAMRVNLEWGLLYLVLTKSTHPVKAYKKTQEIVDGYLSGAMSFDAGELESAISSVIFEIIEREKSVSSAASESLLSQFRGVAPDYNRSLLAKVSQVTLADLIRVGRTYVAPLFDPTQSSVAICCHPSKVEEIKEEFKSMNKLLSVVTSLDEEFTWTI